MKNIVLFSLILSTCIDAKSLDIVNYDPFKKAKVLLKTSIIKKSVSAPKRLCVDAIFNKKAYINGKFYSVNSVVYGYKIVSIADTYIKVRKKHKIRKIPLIKVNNFANIDRKEQ